MAKSDYEQTVHWRSQGFRYNSSLWSWPASNRCRILRMRPPLPSDIHTLYFTLLSPTGGVMGEEGREALAPVRGKLCPPGGEFIYFLFGRPDGPRCPKWRELSSFRRLLLLILNMSFTARRYASALHAVVVCLSVRLSVCLSVCHKPALYQNG